MNIVYKHTNVIARDWKALAAFYTQVFQCRPVPPERHLSGDWLARGTGVEQAAFSGMHLRLPGHGAHGPTLEIYQYESNAPRPPSCANREGYGHLAFEVEDVPAMVERVLAHGGAMLGEVVSHPVEGVGLLTFVYMTDPEGNVIELQQWSN